MDDVNSFTCDCPAGYTGDTCQTGTFSIYVGIDLHEKKYAFVLFDGVIFELVCNK